MLLIVMYFGKGALTDEQKGDISRKVTDLVVNESKQPKEGTWVVINEIAAENCEHLVLNVKRDVAKTFGNRFERWTKT